MVKELSDMDYVPKTVVAHCRLRERRCATGSTSEPKPVSSDSNEYVDGGRVERRVSNLRDDPLLGG